MNDGERLLQKIERAADKGHLYNTDYDTGVWKEYELEIQATIAAELGRIRAVLEREFGSANPYEIERQRLLAIDEEKWDGVFHGDYLSYRLLDDGSFEDMGFPVRRTGLRPRMFTKPGFGGGWMEAVNGYPVEREHDDPARDLPGSGWS